MTMFIAGPAGGEPLQASVPPARALPPLAPAGDRSTTATSSSRLNGFSQPYLVSDTQMNGHSNGQGGGGGGGGTSVGVRSGEGAPAEVIAAAAASSDRALRGEISSLAADLQVAASELSDSRNQSRCASWEGSTMPGPCRHCGHRHQPSLQGPESPQAYLYTHPTSYR